MYDLLLNANNETTLHLPSFANSSTFCRQKRWPNLPKLRDFEQRPDILGSFYSIDLSCLIIIVSFSLPFFFFLISFLSPNPPPLWTCLYFLKCSLGTKVVGHVGLVLRSICWNADHLQLMVYIQSERKVCQKKKGKKSHMRRWSKINLARWMDGRVKNDVSEREKNINDKSVGFPRSFSFFFFYFLLFSFFFFFILKSFLERAPVTQWLTC